MNNKANKRREQRARMAARIVRMDPQLLHPVVRGTGEAQLDIHEISWSGPS